MTTPARAAWTALLLLCGTSLAWWLVVEPAPRALAVLALAGLGVAAWWRAPARAATHAALVAGAFSSALVAGPLAMPHPHAGRLLEVLFSSQGGLLFWSPGLWLGVLGLGLVARRAPARAAALAAAVLAFVVVAAGMPDPPSSPGLARFAPLLAFLAPGLDAVLVALARLTQRRPEILLAALGGLAVLSNLLFMQQYRDGLVPRDDTVAFPQMAEGSARLLSDAVGTPVAWPANWVFARRQLVPVGRADLLMGADWRGRVIDVGVLDQDAAVLFEGWSVRRACGVATCREVEGRARLLVPLGAPEALDLAVRAAGEGELGVELNGVLVVRQRLGPALDDVTVRLPAQHFRAPLNEVVLAVSAGGRAAVDRLAFTRVGEP